MSSTALWQCLPAGSILFTLLCTPTAASAQDRQVKHPAPNLQETVTVTATRLPSPARDLTGVVAVIDAADLAARPALGLDEALRWEPAFSLFRRTSARTAHPTSQGVNLRGIGPSGTSRTAVLADGLPITDAFGGWVYWDRIPKLAIRRVEIAPGGGSAPFGNASIGGTLQVLTRRPGARGAPRVRMLAGGQRSWELGAATNLVLGPARALVAVELFDTAGYLTVSRGQRGPVDTRAGSSHQSGWVRASWSPPLTLTLNGLRERRGNGTPEQHNRTWELGASAVWRPLRVDMSRGWSASGFLRRQVFRSRFSRILPARVGEVPVLLQRVPSWDAGVAIQAWSTPLRQATVSVGGDWRRVSGRSEETVVSIGLRRAPGGRQNLGGVYAAGHLQASRLGIDLSVRADTFANRSRTSGNHQERFRVSPRLGLAWTMPGHWRLQGSVYLGWRAPTLNELYRQFRVGNVVTRANEGLREETLMGGELGLGYRHDWPGGQSFRINVVGYRSRLRNAVLNVTLTRTPDLVLRQRQNLGLTTTRGLELRARWYGRRWRAGLGALWTDARLGASAGLAVAGNRPPQVPSFRFSFTGGYTHARGWSALAALHGTGRQYEDDRNLLALAPGVTMDVAVDIPLGVGVRAQVQAQNLTGKRLQTGRTPLVRLGSPRTLLLGVSFGLGGRGSSGR